MKKSAVRSEFMKDSHWTWNLICPWYDLPEKLLGYLFSTINYLYEKYLHSFSRRRKTRTSLFFTKKRRPANGKTQKMAGKRGHVVIFAVHVSRIQLFRERLSNWKALKRTRQYRKAWWVVVVYCCIVKFTSFQRVGRRCNEYLFACVKLNKMDFELLTCLLKFIEHFPDYLSVLSRMLLSFFLDNLCRNSCNTMLNLSIIRALWLLL